MTGKLCIAMGGGPTAVINRTLVAAIEEGKKRGKTILGARHGVDGIMKREFTRLDLLPSDTLYRIKLQSGAAIGSTRTSPIDRKADDQHWRLKKILAAFDDEGIDRFLYIGGNDTADAVNWISGHAKEQGSRLVAAHGPKTVDNDLVGTDRCPGWASTVRFNALAIQGLAQDARSLKRVYIIELMGRNSGFIAAGAALARKGDETAPHLIYVPELVFSEEQFLEEVKQAYAKHGYVIAVVSEGIRVVGESMKLVELGKLLKEKAAAADGACDFGHVRLSDAGVAEYLSGLVNNNAKLPATAMVPRHLQRAFPKVAENDALDAELAGKKAVEFLVDGRGGSIVFKTREPGCYSAEVELVDVRLVAGKTRSLDTGFCTTDAANRVTGAFMQYAEPLVGTLNDIVHL